MALISCYECKTTISDSATACPYCGAPARKGQVYFSPLDTPPEKGDYKKVPLWLGILIVVFPLLFVWLLLDKNYSPKDKKIGFIYLAISLLFSFWYFQPPNTTPQPTTSTEQIIPASSQQTNHHDVAVDTTQDEDPSPPDITTTHKNKTSVQVSALKYYADYQHNEVSADQKYKGNNLLLQGMVSGISKDYSGQVYLSILGSNDAYGIDVIHANLQNSELQIASKLTKSDIVQLICTGGTMIMNIPVLDDCQIDGIDQEQHQAITGSKKYLPVPSNDQSELPKHNPRPNVVVIPAPLPIEETSDDQDISPAIDQIAQLQNVNQL